MTDKVLGFENILIVRSLTKAFSIPGIRVGYGLAHTNLSRLLNRIRPTWNVNSAASRVGSHLLKNEIDFLQKSRRFIERERCWLKNQLSKLDFEVYESQANFLLVNSRNLGLKASSLVNKALPQGIYLRNADTFRGLDKWSIRIAIKKRKENRHLIEILRTCL